MSLTNTTPFVELTQRWSKKLAIYWVVLILVGSSYFYVNQPKFRATLDLVIPEKVQIMFARNFDLKGCTRAKEPYVFGFDLHNMNQNNDCSYGSNRGSSDWVALLILPPIGLLIGSWLITFFSRRMGEYQVGKKAVDLISEHNYLQAYKEIEDDDIQRPELWAKAFALSDGDEAKQESIYVELRARQLDDR
ncbi:MAG: hypothetical protein ABGY11_06725 [Candidatus Thioglobus sp.]|jgi:hypothetical protein